VVKILWMVVLFAIALLLITGLLYKISPFKRFTIFEYQKGLKYSRGHFVATLGAGQYWIFPKVTFIVPVDIRAEFITIPGQEVLSADGVSLKISLATEFEVVDPEVALHKTVNYRSALYLSLQMALREIVASEKIEDLLQGRTTLGPKLLERSSKKANEYGLKLRIADVKDIMLTGDLKKSFSQVLKAQKEGQAALERARGESAALRNLANAARLMDDNPNLLQLRALQGLGESQGNTLVLGLPNVGVPLGKNKTKPDAVNREEPPGE
jgi:regulator of protease activity HflC (stomatin/prohibitin superfamily)